MTAARGYFYPRSPCGERLAAIVTPPAPSYFYPRSPCGERQLYNRAKGLPIKFLSTLSLRRATRASRSIRIRHENFYPRSPCGERRNGGQQILIQSHISIHALLAESDFCHSCFCGVGFDFYPRSPCGERPVSLVFFELFPGFLSTLSLRRATSGKGSSSRRPGISIPLSLRRATRDRCM